MSLACPTCKADIDDDSFYCDQCGAELLKCGRCGFVGKGKVCPHDRTPLMPAKALAGGSPPPASKSMTPAGAGTSAVGPAPTMPLPPAAQPAISAASTAGPGLSPSPAVAAAPGQVLCLRSAAHGGVLRPASGDVLGRRFGPHAAVLSRFSQISSNHLELRRDGNGVWFAKDMNSFNHSFYNGAQLAPQQEQRLDAGGLLSLGDVAFIVSLE
jgi:hypothetical protein